MTSIDPKHFDYSEQDGVATICLNRPDRLNALTFDSYAELRDTFVALRSRDSVRSVLITGTGRAFCSGGDVEDIIGAMETMPDEKLFEFTRMTCDLIENIRTLEKPVIAALNGTTCGAGAVMAIAADMRIAVPKAKIAFLFVKVGLSGADMGAGWLLPRIVGFGHASELLLRGEFISAERAFEIGLYNKVVEPGDLMDVANEWAAGLAAGPSLGNAVTKRMLNAEASMTLTEAMQQEGWVQAECMRHPDYKRIIAGFNQKKASKGK